MKKRLALILLVLVMSLSVVFAACDIAGNTEALDGAAAVLKSLYKDDSTSTAADYTRVAQVAKDGVTYPITWTTDAAESVVKIVPAEDGKSVTISVVRSESADVNYVLTATISDGKNSVKVTYNYTIPKLEYTTIADFLTKEVSEDVSYSIKGYVTATGGSHDKEGSFVVTDATGSVFSYNKQKVEVGDLVVVYGTRSVNSGVAQIGTKTCQIVEGGTYTAPTATTLDGTTIDLSKISKDNIGEYTGKYYKITGTTYSVNDSGYALTTIGGTQVLNLYTNDALLKKAENYINAEVNVYGFVRGFSAGKYLTIQLTDIEPVGDVVIKTDAEKVDIELAAIAKDGIANITATGDVTLTSKGTTYGTVAITWTLADTDAATLKDNVLTVAALPTDADATITLTPTAKCGDVTKAGAPITVTIKKFVEKAKWENKVAGAEIKTFAELTTLAASDTTNKYYAMGYIKSIENEKYGNAYIEDQDGNTFYIYGMYNVDGSVSFSNLPESEKPIVGTLVVLYGKLSVYNNNAQMKNAWIMQINDTVCTVTDEAKAAAAVASLGKASVTIATAGEEVALPTVDGVKITWELAEGTTACTLTADGLKVTAATLPADADVTVKATATVIVGDVQKTVDINITVKAPVEAGSSVKLSFPDDGGEKVSSYSATWTAKAGTTEFTVTNFNNNQYNNWKWIKCGSKNAASVASIATKNALSIAVKTVSLEIDRITSDKVNSIKLVVASDAAFENVVETLDVTRAAGTQKVTIKTPAANQYYKLVFDCQQGSSNGLVTVVSVEFAA